MLNRVYGLVQLALWQLIAVSDLEWKRVVRSSCDWKHDGKGLVFSDVKQQFYMCLLLPTILMFLVTQLSGGKMSSFLLENTDSLGLC